LNNLIWNETFDDWSKIEKELSKLIKAFQYETPIENKACQKKEIV